MVTHVSPESPLAFVCSPGWTLQRLEPQSASGVERHHDLVSAQDLQAEGETPHVHAVGSRRPRQGDAVL